jgi:hypothetical protein
MFNCVKHGKHFDALDVGSERPPDPANPLSTIDKSMSLCYSFN